MVLTLSERALVPGAAVLDELALAPRAAVRDEPALAPRAAVRGQLALAPHAATVDESAPMQVRSLATEEHQKIGLGGDCRMVRDDTQAAQRQQQAVGF